MKLFKLLPILAIAIFLSGCFTSNSEGEIDIETQPLEEEITTRDDDFLWSLAGSESNISDKCKEYKIYNEGFIKDPEMCLCDFDIDSETSENPECTLERLNKNQEEENIKLEEERLKEERLRQEEEEQINKKWKELCSGEYVDRRIAEECLWFNKYSYCKELTKGFGNEWYYDPFEFEEIKKGDQEQPKYTSMNNVEQCENYFVYFNTQDAINDEVSRIYDELENLSDEVRDIYYSLP